MKGISLWEPWASLIRTGAKTWETRSWETSYRGPLLICASKAGLTFNELQGYLCQAVFQDALAPLIGLPLRLNNIFEPYEPNGWPGIKYSHLEFGKAVALVNLVDCRRTETLTLQEIATDHHFGNFILGRFAWKLEMLDNSFQPFEIKGRQGLFNIGLDQLPLTMITAWRSFLEQDGTYKAYISL
jgi:hypothetical protein